MGPTNLKMRVSYIRTTWQSIMTKRTCGWYEIWTIGQFNDTEDWWMVSYKRLRHHGCGASVSDTARYYKCKKVL
jgi:hypothetical protein